MWYRLICMALPCLKFKVLTWILHGSLMMWIETSWVNKLCIDTRLPCPTPLPNIPFVNLSNQMCFHTELNSYFFLWYAFLFIVKQHNYFIKFSKSFCFFVFVTTFVIIFFVSAFQVVCMSILARLDEIQRSKSWLKYCWK